MSLLDAFNEYQSSNINSPLNRVSPAQSTNIKEAGKAGLGTVASGVISGIADIATKLLSVERAKNTYKFNSTMAQLQGRMNRLAANVEIQNIRKRAQSIFSYQQAAYAARGVKAFSGSPALVMLNSLKEAELDAIYTDISATYNIGTIEANNQINQMEYKSQQADTIIGVGKTILSTYNKSQE